MPVVVPISGRWQRQPAGQPKIDWSNPLTRGLIFCISGTAPFRDTVKGRQPTFTGTVSELASTAGKMAQLGASQYIDYPVLAADEISSTTPTTIAWV